MPSGAVLLTCASEPQVLVPRSRLEVQDDAFGAWLYRASAEQTRLLDVPKAVSEAHGREMLASLLSHRSLHVSKQVLLLGLPGVGSSACLVRDTRELEPRFWLGGLEPHLLKAVQLAGQSWVCQCC